VVEALWAPDQPPGKLNLQAMVRDTLAALQQLPSACPRLRDNLPKSAHSTLAHLESNIRAQLNPAEACNMVPGQTPKSFKHPCLPEPAG
jgi:hypothetical protein